jgi:hypothetical protein
VIACSSSSSEDGIQTTTGTYGRLDVYSLGNLWSENTVSIAHPIVQLFLPALPRKLPGSSIRIRHTGSSASSSYTCPSSKPKLYDLLPSSRMLCLDIKAWGPGPYGTLLIPIDLILKVVCSFCGPPVELLEPRLPDYLLWSDWAHGTYWNDTAVLDTIIPHSASRKRFAEPKIHQNTPGAGASGGISVWDFDRPPLVEFHVPSTPRHPTATGFFAGTAVPRRGIETVTQVDPAFLPLTSVLLDSEYGTWPFDYRVIQLSCY